MVDYLLGQAIPPDRELANLVAQIAGFASANPVAAPSRQAS
jgi:hypothetical protein